MGGAARGLSAVAIVNCSIPISRSISTALTQDLALTQDAAKALINLATKTSFYHEIGLMP